MILFFYVYNKILLQSKCNFICEKYDEEFSMKLHQEYNIKYNSISKIDREEKKVIKAARAIIKNSNSLPKDRLNLLNNRIITYLGTTKYSDKDIIESINNNILVANKNIIKKEEKPSSYYIIQEIMKNGENSILDFVKRWRKNFCEVYNFIIQNMNPKYLPKYWNIDNPLENIHVIIKKYE